VRVSKLSACKNVVVNNCLRWQLLTNAACGQVMMVYYVFVCFLNVPEDYL